ncbi:MAG TPA: hypothetical protein VJJ98_04785, partial [Sedimentisphaerales bacterium]|nr:hypothetical protein [Sedimentisphaerales bacterium]
SLWDKPLRDKDNPQIHTGHLPLNLKYEIRNLKSNPPSIAANSSINYSQQISYLPHAPISV